MKKISRKNFLRLASATVLSSVAASTLSACGSSAGTTASSISEPAPSAAPEEVPAAPAEQSAVSWRTPPKAIGDEQIAAAYVSDIVIIGAGAAGMAASAGGRFRHNRGKDGSRGFFAFQLCSVGLPFSEGCWHPAEQA